MFINIAVDFFVKLTCSKFVKPDLATVDTEQMFDFLRTIHEHYTIKMKYLLMIKKR